MRKRFLLSALLLFALVLLPSLSLADDGFGGSVGGSFDGDYGVKYTAVTHDGGWTGFLVKAADSWSAAVYACGGDPARISADVRSKLSDPDYGGAFYMYATNYAHIMSVYEIPEFVPLYVLAGLGISSAWHGEFGDMMLWYADTPNSLLESAMVDFRRVLAGEDLSGGSGSPSASLPPGDYYEIDTSDAGMYPYPAGHEVNKVYLNVDFVDAYFAQFASVTPARKFYLYVRTDSHGTHPGFDYVSSWALSGSPNWYVKYADLWYMSSGMQWFHDDENNWYYAYLNGQDLQFSYGGGTNNSFSSSLGHYHFATDFSRDFPIVRIGEPGGDWPDNPVPVTPDPPEIPTPTAPTVTPDPVVTDPSVTWPDIDITVNPPAVVVPTTPEGQDYTSLLTLINDNLNSIDAYTVAINSSLNSLRSDLLVGFDSVVSAIRNVYTYLRHLDDLLERHCKHIRDSIDDNFYELELYLKGLFEWLPEQLKFDSVYDDSAVVDWLRQIYYKLGGGTYAPNPVADPGGFFGWLGGLVAGFLASLLAGLPGKIQELLSDLSDLTGYFPFSAPWDLYALLALFSHEPVTPVFTLPWGLGGGHTVNVVVDCSQWDGIMSIVRSVEKIIFAGGLAKLTFDMFRPTDVTGD